MSYITYQQIQEVPKGESLTQDMTKNVPIGIYFASLHTKHWWACNVVETNALLPDTIPDPKDPTKQIPNPDKLFKGV